MQTRLLYVYFIFYFLLCASPPVSIEYYYYDVISKERSEEDGKVETLCFVCSKESVKKKVEFGMYIISLDDREGPHMVQWETDSAVSTSIPAASSFNLPKKKKVKRKKKELRLCRVEKKRPGPRHTGGGVLWIMH